MIRAIVLARLAQLARVFQLFRHRLACADRTDASASRPARASGARVSFSRISLIFMAHPSSSRLHLRNRMLARARTGSATGILWATRARARLAVGSSTPVISNITVPGFTTAHPVFRLALALTHAGFQRLAGDRLVREDADEHAAFAAQEVAARHATGFDLPGGDPGTIPATAGRTRRRRPYCRGWRCPSSCRAGFCGTSPAWASLA